MDISQLHTSLKELYKTYNEVVKFLIIEIEYRSQKFPLPLFNEIRAFNDHIARCYLDGATNETVNTEVKIKAERHLTRITLDCYKFLIILLDDKLKLFERQTRNIDLSIIQFGEFYNQYRFLKKKSRKAVREAVLLERGSFYIRYKELVRLCMTKVKLAKRKEISSNSDAVSLYKESYENYVELESLIESIIPDVKWARFKFGVSRLLKIILFIAAAIISGLISLFFTCPDVANFLKSFIE